MSSCFPQTELSHNSSIGKVSQPTIIKPDIRSALSSSRAPSAVLPFQTDVHGFAPKLQDIASALYGVPYGSPSAFYQGLPAAQGVDPAAFYHSLNRANSKDLTGAWRSPHPPFPSYDPSLASFFYSGGFSHLALADGVRGRKNATRETTTVLKAWLDEHKKNPYPTKGEKVVLAIMAKMTLTQVSTWFANARRRLKKENKMTWSPRNCCGDERDSGDENAEHSFSISPQNHEGGLESNHISPTKDTSEPPQLPDMRNGSANANDLPYQQYQQQMLLRQLALLPPYLRTPEALKQVQEQMQVRSRWAATASSEAEPRTSHANHLSPHQLPKMIDDKIQQQRRSSVGSPSTSSYDRSPSPLHRHLPSTWAPPSITDQPTAFRKSASVSESPLDSLTPTDEKKDSDRARTKSTEEPRKVKPSIWSPVSMVGDKPAASKNNLSNGNALSHPELKASTNFRIENSLKLSGLSNGIATDAAASGRGGFLEKAKLSPSDETAKYQATIAQVYLREIQRQYASQGSSLHHGIAPLMMPMQLEKTQQALAANPQLLEQMQRNQSLQTQLLFANNALGKETANYRSHDTEIETINDDTPMNLSKSSRSPERTLNLKEMKDFALASDSAMSVNAV